jgi:hypothetical protein
VSDDSDHLADLSDGAGCAEVWEHLSEEREEATAEEEDDPDDGSPASVDSEAGTDGTVASDSGPTDNSGATADGAEADAADATADESTEQETTGASHA